MYASVVPKYKHFHLQPDTVTKDWGMVAQDCTHFKSPVAELENSSQLKYFLKNPQGMSKVLGGLTEFIMFYLLNT